MMRCHRKTFAAAFLRYTAAPLLVSLVAGCLASCSSSHASQPAPEAAANDDLQSLEAALEDAHPNLFFHESKAAFERSIERERTQLGLNASPTEEFEAVAPILSDLGDAHTQVNVDTRDFAAFRDGGGILFPLEFRYQEGRAIVTLDYDDGHGMPAGTEIVAIGGTPIADLMTGFERYESGETAELRGYAASVDIRELLWDIGVRAPFDVTLRNGSGTARGSLPGATWAAIDAYHGSNPEAPGVAEVKFQIDAQRSIGVLTLRDFNFQDDARWQAAIQTILQQLRTQHVHALIIDVRENAGGSTHFSDELLAMFAKRRYRDFSHITEKVSSVTQLGLDKTTYLSRYGPNALNAADGTMISAEATYTAPLPASDVFAGKVYVLTGVGSVSTAAIFAAAVQDSGNGSVWGQPSGGYPTLYGEIYPFTLPQSGLQVTVSTKYFVRPSGNRAAEGVTPDRFFAATPEGAHDTEMDQVKRAINISDR